MTPPAPRPVRDRIANRIVVGPSGCWEWQGSRDRHGYGRIRVGSHTDGTSRTAFVHRVSYEEHVGAIPEGLALDHLCRNPACCNPAHLEAVTQRENLLRGNTIGAANAAKTCCPKCGGSYTTVRFPSRSGSERICMPCKREYQRRVRGNAREHLTLVPDADDTVADVLRPSFGEVDGDWTGDAA